MNSFYNKLKKYIFKNRAQLDSGTAPHFKFNEFTIIDPEIAIEIFGIYESFNSVKNLWEKEKDYSRLLKNENISLQEELDHIYSEDNFSEEDEEYPNNLKNKEKEYLS